ELEPSQATTKTPAAATALKRAKTEPGFELKDPPLSSSLSSSLSPHLSSSFSFFDFFDFFFFFFFFRLDKAVPSRAMTEGVAEQLFTEEVDVLVDTTEDDDVRAVGDVGAWLAMSVLGVVWTSTAGAATAARRMTIDFMMEPSL
ncbi:hypothetical protein BKA61DRAFT_345647, partial [Leptodontidium sp. MPI-SDFR-AT-0119]